MNIKTCDGEMHGRVPSYEETAVYLDRYDIRCQRYEREKKNSAHHIRFQKIRECLENSSLNTQNFWK